MTPSSRRQRLLAIAGRCAAVDRDRLAPLISAIRESHGDALAAVVYYGSCFRAGDAYAGLVDFYVIVDSYRGANQGPVSAVANYLLPPNVYYLERDGVAGVLRCKYALLAIDQLEAGVRRWFQSSLWGRFAQPVGLVYARSEADCQRVRTACGDAVVTLLRRALPALASRLPAHRAFGHCLALSYAVELRVETATRGDALVGADAREYRRRLAAAAPLLPFCLVYTADGHIVSRIGRGRRAIARLAWPLRRAHGRALSLLRLAKACFTFSGAIDYGAWKLARHTGIAIEVTPRLRRHPLIHGWGVLWRLYRQRKLR